MKFRLSFTLILLASLLAALLGLAGVPSAHAQSNITDCTDDTQLRSAITNATSGETITFGCSGTIPITVANGPLVIGTTLTLDGNGQSVTLDGQNQVEVLQVNGGVTFNLNALTIAHGSASGGFDGGGLYNGGTVNISNSTFAYNSDVSGIFGGGGLFSQSGTVTIGNSTFYNNSAEVGGGLLSLSSTVNISNSTFANNSATFGGGLRNDGGTVSISNSTFANNAASQGGGGGGLSTESNGTLSIAQSIAADNRGGNCQGTISSKGYNLESGMDCGFTGTGDLQNTNPLLDPAGLANNGGPTQTIALQQGSPAIDHVPAASCPASDQRGVTRLQGEHCDIGAFEFPDTTAPTLSLPGTITVNANGSGVAVVTYTATATDDDGDTLAATCAPASGSMFSIGTTTVNCSASEPGSNTSSGSFSVVVMDITPPALSLPGTITVDATSPQGVVVTYTAIATDDDGTNPAVTCTPASGSTFAIGTTTVGCSATDAAGNTATGSFQVVVNDTDLGLTNLTTNMTTNATSPQGATVTYTPPTVVDEDSPLPTVSCTPASGSTFAIGTTTVTCTVSDSDDTPSSVSQTFTVTVKGAAAQVSDLITTVQGLPIASGLKASLVDQLQTVLADLQANNTAQACLDLTSFINHVKAQSGKGLTTSQATQLLTAATRIKAVLGC